MNDPDSLFEQALRDGLAARTDDLDAPTDQGGRAVHAARRRAARRAGLIGTPVVAAAAVAVVLVSGGGGGATRGGHVPATAQSPAPTHPSVIDAAYVIKRVRARVRQLGASDRVEQIITSTRYRQLSIRWAWTDPHSHVRYTQVQSLDRQGNYSKIYWGRERLVGGDRLVSVALRVDRTQRTWSLTRSIRPVETPAVPRIDDPSREIAHALSHDHVRLCPNEMIGGQHARCLLLHYGPGTSSRLWVNARTYRPINQTIFRRDPKTHRLINILNLFLRPATKSTIAQAKDRPQFHGYTRVTRR